MKIIHVWQTPEDQVVHVVNTKTPELFCNFFYYSILTTAFIYEAAYDITSVTK